MATTMDIHLAVRIDDPDEGAELYATLVAAAAGKVGDRDRVDAGWQGGRVTKRRVLAVSQRLGVDVGQIVSRPWVKVRDWRG